VFLSLADEEENKLQTPLSSFVMQGLARNPLQKVNGIAICRSMRIFRVLVEKEEEDSSLADDAA
jgi:hypothetical protein